MKRHQQGIGRASSPPWFFRFLVLMIGSLCVGVSSHGANVVAWGNNLYGQTNTPADLTNAVIIDAGYYHNVALRRDGRVTAWGQNTYGQTNVPSSVTNAVAIAAGGYHSLALKSDGTVVAWETIVMAR